MPEGAASIARLLLYIGAVVMIGHAVLAMASPSLPVASTTASRAVVLVGVIALLVAPWALLQLQLGALEMAFVEAPMLLRETAWGHGWIGVTVCALLSAGVLVLIAIRRTTGSPGLLLTLLTGVALAIAMGALGHAAADARFPVMARVVDAIHVLAMGGWIGGLILIGAATRDGPPARVIPEWQAFSRFATILAPVALLSGVVSSLLRLAEAFAGPVSWPSITASRYVQLLVAKGAVVLAVLAYGAVQRRRVHRAEAPPARAVVQESMLAFVALAITAVLTGTEPPSVP